MSLTQFWGLDLSKQERLADD